MLCILNSYSEPGGSLNHHASGTRAKISDHFSDYKTAFFKWMIIIKTKKIWNNSIVYMFLGFSDLLL